eukprot:COSAG04_NODE_878_length_9680_cov_2.690951_10_plen_315_part_00
MKGDWGFRTGLSDCQADAHCGQRQSMLRRQTTTPSIPKRSNESTHFLTNTGERTRPQGQFDVNVLTYGPLKKPTKYAFLFDEKNRVLDNAHLRRQTISPSSVASSAFGTSLHSGLASAAAGSSSCSSCGGSGCSSGFGSSEEVVPAQIARQIRLEFVKVKCVKLELQIGCPIGYPLAIEEQEEGWLRGGAYGRWWWPAARPFSATRASQAPSPPAPDANRGSEIAPRHRRQEIHQVGNRLEGRDEQSKYFRALIWHKPEAAKKAVSTWFVRSCGPHLLVRLLLEGGDELLHLSVGGLHRRHLRHQRTLTETDSA